MKMGQLWLPWLWTVLTVSLWILSHLLGKEERKNSSLPSWNPKGNERHLSTQGRSQRPVFISESPDKKDRDEWAVLVFQLYHNLETGEAMKEYQDSDVPVFDYRDYHPLADKENYLDLFDTQEDIIRDFSQWGTLYRNAVPEPFIPHLSRRNGKYTKKIKKENRQLQPDNSLAMAAKGTKRKNAFSYGYDLIGRGIRLPAHMTPRDFALGMELPDTLPALEAASADWKIFEDWQIVMTTSVMQGLPPAQTGIPAAVPTTCELVSYVTSAANSKYRQTRDCQLRLKTIKMREEKETSSDSLPVSKKKKKNKEDVPAFDKLPIPVPKRTTLAVQDDNGRIRTKSYRDVCSTYRNFSYCTPSSFREPGAMSRNIALVSSNQAMAESNINLDDPMDPISILKRRLERTSVSNKFVSSDPVTIAAKLGITVDTHGQPTNQAFSRTSILHQALSPGGPVTPRTPLPSPHQLVINQNSQRRPTYPTSLPVSNVSPGSPLPSLSSSINQYMGQNVNTVSAMQTSGPVVGSVAVSPQPARTQLSQQQSAAKFQQLRTFFQSKQDGASTVLDPQKIRDFLVTRGIQFTDAQINELVRCFGTKTTPDGPQQVIAPAQAAPVTTSAMAIMGPTSPPVAVAARPPTLNLTAAAGQQIVRLPVAGRALTPTSNAQMVNVSFAPTLSTTNAPQVAQILKNSVPLVKRTPSTGPAVNLLKNGAVVSGAPPNVTIAKSITAQTAALPVQIIPSTGTPDLRAASPNSGTTTIRISQDQYSRIISLVPGQHNIRHTSAGMVVQRTLTPHTTGTQLSILPQVNAQTGQAQNVLVISQGPQGTGAHPANPVLQLQTVPQLHLQSADGTSRTASPALSVSTTPVAQQPPSQPP